MIAGLREALTRERDIAWLGRAVIVLSAAAFACVHLCAIFREGVNWDEFALLARATDTLRTGNVVAGGRPGLGTIVLIPFVQGCTDSVAAVMNARVLWSLFTFGYLGGIYALVKRFDGKRGWSGAGVVAVALLALVPFFQRWSLQVRTDQPALAFATWGAVALLATGRHYRKAALGGALFATGYLFSQKAVYVVGLSALLTLGQAWVARDLKPRREATRAALALIVAGGVYLLYLAAVSMRFQPVISSAQGVFQSMDPYRRLGLLILRALPALMIPHMLLGGLLVIVTLGRSHHSEQDFRRGVVALLVVVMGVAVSLIHGSRFAYFWMTLGLFGAVAAGIAWGPITRLLRQRNTLVLSVVVAVLLLRYAAPMAAEVVTDTASIQTRTLAFLERNFAGSARGFQPESALFCRAEPDPIGTYFLPRIQRLSDTGAKMNSQTFVEEFRKRPVNFVVHSHMLHVFPMPVREFWRDAYVRYAQAVWVPGRNLDGQVGDRFEFEVVVASDYVFYAPHEGTSARIEVHGREVVAGESVRLLPGRYEVELLSRVRTGMLALRLAEPPSPQSIDVFYPSRNIREIDGERRFPVWPEGW